MTSIVRPLTPPFALISAAAMRTTWFRRPSMLAIVPEDENRQPSLTVPAAWAGRTIAGIATDVVSAAAPSPVPRRNERRENLAENLAIGSDLFLRVRSDFRSSSLARQRQIVFSAAQAVSKDFGFQSLVSILPFRMQTRALDTTATVGRKKRVRMRQRRGQMPIPRAPSPYQTTGIYAIRPRSTTYEGLRRCVARSTLSTKFCSFSKRQMPASRLPKFAARPGYRCAPSTVGANVTEA